MDKFRDQFSKILADIRSAKTITNIDTHEKNATKLSKLWARYITTYLEMVVFENHIFPAVLIHLDRINLLPEHKMMRNLDMLAEQTIDTMIQNLKKSTNPKTAFVEVQRTIDDIINGAPKRLQGIKKLRSLRTSFTANKVIQSYFLRQRRRQQAKKELRPWFLNKFLPQLRMKVLKKGMRLFRGTASKEDDVLWKHYIYMSDNPFAFRFLQGVNVKYLHEYELTKDIYLMDFVSHPEMCRPDFKQILDEHDHYKRLDKESKTQGTDPEPSSLLQLWMYQTKRIVGHIGLASLDCPLLRPNRAGYKLHTVLKENRRKDSKGFPEYIFYNYLPILHGMKWIKRVSVREVTKRKLTEENNKNIDTFYAQFDSPKSISPSKVIGKKLIKTNNQKK